MFSNLEIEKLRELFKEKYADLHDERNCDKYVAYCDEHNFIILNPEWLEETINSNKIDNYVCLNSPYDSYVGWILIPNEFAKRVLVMKGFP